MANAKSRKEEARSQRSALVRVKFEEEKIGAADVCEQLLPALKKTVNSRPRWVNLPRGSGVGKTPRAQLQLAQLFGQTVGPSAVASAAAVAAASKWWRLPAFWSRRNAASAGGGCSRSGCWRWRRPRRRRGHGSGGGTCLHLFHLG